MLAAAPENFPAYLLSLGHFVFYHSEWLKLVEMMKDISLYINDG